MNQAILNNIIDKGCACCEQVWLTLTPDLLPVLYYEGFDVAGLATVEWQRYEDIGLGILEWVTKKTGGTDLTPFVYGDGDIWRVKYTDALGCNHYSNVAYTYFA